MQIYLVGGAVRDQLLNRPIKERDYVVVGATEEQMLTQGFTRVGKDFPVFLHPKSKEEYALARTERKKGLGYSGFECHASPEVTLEQDLLRRDLTINAMALSDDQQIIDPYNGQQDLSQRIFRHVSAAFAEDPLRVFRIARFMARYHSYGFTIAPETLKMMRAMCSEQEMRAISAERIWQETARALMEPAPFRYFQVLQDAGALTHWFSEWRDVDFYTENFTRIDGSQDHEPQMLEQRFALICQLCETFLRPAGKDSHEALQNLSLLRTRLKLPNSVFMLAKLLLAENCRWFTSISINESLSARQILDGFDHIDLWRNPQRLTELTECLRFTHDNNDSRLELIRRCAQVSLGLNVQTIIADGKRGAEIKSALITARLNLIQMQLDKPSI